MTWGLVLSKLLRGVIFVLKCPLLRSWKCSECKPVNVDKKVTVGYDRVMANLPNRKVVTVKQTIIKCEKSNKKDHYQVRKGKKYLTFERTRVGHYFSGMGDRRKVEARNKKQH